MASKTLAIIPARGGSKRLPGKNVRPFLGRPLIHWTIEFARSVKQFDAVVVSTDSDEIAACCDAAGLFVGERRAADLATDTATSVDVALDALQKAEGAGQQFDYVALLQPTTPLRDVGRWNQAFALMEHPATDAVIGVSPVTDHPFHVFTPDAELGLTPWCDMSARSLRAQDLPRAVVVNGALYVVRSAVLKATRTFFPPATKMVMCDAPLELIDIDTEADWVAAEALANFFMKRT
jgi:CMP-N,N'-diacetyllegionaminic acid synthase